MGISLFATIITIIVGLLTIFQFIKESIKPNLIAKVQQSNTYGDNYYTDSSTTIKNTTTNTTINTSYSGNNETENNWFIIGFVFLILLIILSLYPMVYKLIPAICFLLLTVRISRDSKLPFENHNAKIQWIIKKVMILIMIIILFFIPKSILNIIDQIPIFSFESLNSFSVSLKYSFIFLYNLQKESTLSSFNLIGRIVVTFGLLYFLFISVFTKIGTHKSLSKTDLIMVSVVPVLLICILNIEYVWNLIEPLRYSIDSWINPPQ